MDEIFNDARERGLIIDLPDGGIRMKPELEYEMPLLYSLIREVQRMEFEQTVSSLMDKGLVEMSGVSEDGEIAFKLTEAGLEVRSGAL